MTLIDLDVRAALLSAGADETEANAAGIAAARRASTREIRGRKARMLGSFAMCAVAGAIIGVYVL